MENSTLCRESSNSLSKIDGIGGNAECDATRNKIDHVKNEEANKNDKDGSEKLKGDVNVILDKEHDNRNGGLERLTADEENVDRKRDCVKDIEERHTKKLKTETENMKILKNDKNRSTDVMKLKDTETSDIKKEDVELCNENSSVKNEGNEIPSVKDKENNKVRSESKGAKAEDEKKDDEEAGGRNDDVIMEDKEKGAEKEESLKSDDANNVEDMDTENIDRSSPETKENTTPSDPTTEEPPQKTEETASFVLRPPVTAEEVGKVETHVKKMISSAVKILDSDGVEALLASGIITYTLDRIDDSDAKSTGHDKKNKHALEEAVVRGNPRKYQMALFEKAKEKNTIVNLGTGQGKTLVALLCIKHFSEPAYSLGQQTLFLVPSIALAVQHTTTLRANLPFKVATACHTSSNSEHARLELESSNIVVATHGAALDLLRHYGDLFSLDRVNLIVLDECHYTTGNHGYARIMSMFYHRLPKDKRPRVLGLTASPLVNVKPKCTPEQLENALANLEHMLDAELACFSDLGIDMGIEMKLAEERVVQYNNEPPLVAFPAHEHVGLHESRIKELKQLHGLYEDFGPRVTGTYCRILVKEIARNRFEKESARQYERMVEHLKYLAGFCEMRSEVTADDGRSDKLVVLENLLQELLSGGDADDTVGVIFVERRITALALHGYLKAKWKDIQEARKRDEENELADEINCEGKVDNEGNENTQIVKPRKHQNTIRCDMIVRQSTQVFKYLHPSHKLSPDDQRAIHEEKEEWLHRMKKVRDVLDGLRRKETNVLIATSVVEEGVDVDACSFVIVLDHIKTSKAYVQMKGRARRKNAKFFVFENVHPEATGPSMTLAAAQEVERRVRNFIELRESNIPETFDSIHTEPYTGSASSEIKALHEGEYRSTYGYVDMQSAKSLLNRYSLSIPMDATSRSSRQAMLLHMPIYEGYRLTLPAHLPSDVRCVALPDKFREANKKDVQNMLALMACVRLHDLNLLNDRLLPLKRKDMHDRLLSVALQQLPSVQRMKIHESPPMQEETKEVHIYALNQSGKIFSQHEEALQGHGRKLGLLTLAPLIEIPPLSFCHNEMDQIDCSVDKLSMVTINETQWNEIARFYTTIIDTRWRRRTGKMHFRYKFEKIHDGVLPPYVVVALTSDGSLDWERMRKILSDHSRTAEERKNAVSSSTTHITPRLWAPLYDPNVTYISFGPSDVTCSANFPYSDDFKDYASYMEKKRGFAVSPTCPLFVVQRLWLLPRKMYVRRGPYTTIEISRKRKTPEVDDFVSDELQEGERAVLEGLGAALLPQEACMEAQLADASLYLHVVILPQILYNIDRYLTTKGFIDHCKTRIGKLGEYLENIPLQETLEALTAKSCSMVISYDRLEYLGDAVLKLIQTDALLHSKDLRKWVAYLHEGDLSTLRSAMGSNDRLKDATKSMEIDKFILTRPLGRGQWIPVGLEMYDPDEKENVAVSAETGKEAVDDTKHSEKSDEDTKVSQKETDDTIESSQQETNKESDNASNEQSEMDGKGGNNDSQEKKIETSANDGQKKNDKKSQDASQKGNKETEKPAPKRNDDFIPSNKVCADVIEALLGLVYLKFGYEASMTVAEELGISLPVEVENYTTNISTVVPKKELLEMVESIVGFKDFDRQELILEATTHPSCIHEEVPCYQRLEWVGDAVLCLAAREWAYQKYLDLKVAELVVIETTLVCNETLAYIGCSRGLHRFINHRDPSLPHRFLDFEHAIEPQGRGLWGTDPPKVLPDVVEALIGAAHVDRGFKVGQEAALFVLKPVITSIVNELYSEDTQVTKMKAREMMHPKQVVHELAGRYLSARSMREDDFASKHKDCLVWRNGHWAKPNQQSSGAIGQVLCLGLHCLALAESSAHIAKNRACAMAVSFFNNDPDLLEDVKRISDVVKDHLKNEGGDDDDKSGENSDEDDDDDEAERKEMKKTAMVKAGKPPAEHSGKDEVEGKNVVLMKA